MEIEGGDGDGRLELGRLMEDLKKIGDGAKKKERRPMNESERT